jgi:hypothetical protein
VLRPHAGFQIAAAAILTDAPSSRHQFPPPLNGTRGQADKAFRILLPRCHSCFAPALPLLFTLLLLPPLHLDKK